jgi:hypothetical protein
MMKNLFLIGIVIHLMCSSSLDAQDTLLNRKSLCFPTKKYGISLGNSYEFNGIRINFADENVKIVNGLNITFWFRKFKNENAVVNGISIGVMPIAGSMQPINIGLIGTGTDKNNLNGFSFGGILVGSGGNINGFCISGLTTMANGANSVISGFAMSGIGLGAHKAINGFAFGGIAVGTDGNINGIASSLAYISAGNNFNGIAVTSGYLNSGTYNGLAFAGYTNTVHMNGLSFALFNRTQDLHGVQLGLINFVGNNPKGLKLTPLINFHF